MAPDKKCALLLSYTILYFLSPPTFKFSMLITDRQRKKSFYSISIYRANTSGIVIDAPKTDS